MSTFLNDIDFGTSSYLTIAGTFSSSSKTTSAATESKFGSLANTVTISDALITSASLAITASQQLASSVDELEPQSNTLLESIAGQEISTPASKFATLITSDSSADAVSKTSTALQTEAPNTLNDATSSRSSSGSIGSTAAVATVSDEQSSIASATLGSLALSGSSAPAPASAVAVAVSQPVPTPSVPASNTAAQIQTTASSGIDAGGSTLSAGNREVVTPTDSGVFSSTSVISNIDSNNGDTTDSEANPRINDSGLQHASPTPEALSDRPEIDDDGSRDSSNPGTSISGSSSSDDTGPDSEGVETITPIAEPNPNVLSIDVGVTGGTYFVALFAPVMMSLLIKSFWSIVFASAKMMEPFYQLARKDKSVTAKASILRPYLQGGIDWPDLNPKNKYWAMFLTTIVSVFLSVQTSLASEAMTVQAGSKCNTENGTKLCDPVWVMNAAVIRGLQVTLIMVGMMIAILIWLNWNRPSAVTSYPCSITSMASLLSNSDQELIEELRVIKPDAKTEEVETALKHRTFTLTSTSETEADVIGVRMYVEEPEADEDLPNNAPEATRSAGFGVEDLATAARIPSSWLTHIPWSKAYIIIVTIVHLALFGVILSFVLAGNDIYQVNLVGGDGAIYRTAVKWKFLDGTKFGPRFFMTLLIALLFIPFWEMVELEVRIMVPYRRLHNARDAAKIDWSHTRYLFTMYLHGIPFTSFFKALYHRNWYHAFVAFTTMLAYVQLILIAGVPYNYGQIKHVSFYSSCVSCGILVLMVVVMLSLLWWHRTNPQMTRKPDTLVNTWLLMCASEFVADFRGKARDEVIKESESCDGTWWFEKSVGVDGKKRWMIGNDAQKLVNEHWLPEPDRALVERNNFF